MKQLRNREVWFVVPESEEARVWDYTFFDTKIDAEQYARHMQETGKLLDGIPAASYVHCRQVHSWETTHE
jgi:hypothetical protein